MADDVVRRRVASRASGAGKTVRARRRERGDDPASVAGFRFKTRVIHWRGPAPYVFAPIPEEHVGRLRLLARAVTYGWGMIPVTATIRGIAFKTSLFPKDETYLLPIKAAVWRRARIEVGDPIEVDMAVQNDRL